MQKSILAIFGLTTGLFLVAQFCLVLSTDSAWGQDKKTKAAPKSSKTKKPGNTTSLDVKANEIQNGFIKEAEELAGDYFEAGDFDKAKVLLKSIQALKPDHPNLDTKLKLLEEETLASNEVEFEVNASHGWEPAGVLVAEGKTIRIKAEGTFKLSIAGTLGPAGIPAGKTPLDLVGDLPMGGLIGMVLADRTPGDDKDNNKKKERPFLIGEGCDYTPVKNGTLLIRVNSPAENKNTGKIKVQISGSLKKTK